MNIANNPASRNPVSPSRVISIVAAAGFCAAAHAAVPATERNFVACPIVLDTQDVPCWVAEYQGERYFLAVQTGRSAGVTFVPQLKHRVLVEGTAHPDRAPHVRRHRAGSGEALGVPGCGAGLRQDAARRRIHRKKPRPIGPDGDPPGGKTTAVRVQRPGPPVAPRSRRNSAPTLPLASPGSSRSSISSAPTTFRSLWNRRPWTRLPTTSRRRMTRAW